MVVVETPQLKIADPIPAAHVPAAIPAVQPGHATLVLQAATAVPSAVAQIGYINQLTVRCVPQNSRSFALTKGDMAKLAASANIAT